MNGLKKGRVEMQEFEKGKHYGDDYKRNGSGYIDPTAYEAIKRAEAERERYQKMIGCLMRICELSDFAFEERVVLRDKRTGKVWW